MNRNITHFTIAILFIISLQGCDEKNSPNPVASNIKWIDVSQENCTLNGGTMFKGICKANWNNAGKICTTLGSQLPSKNMLENLITECMSISRNNSDESKQQKLYRNCMENKGFSDSSNYWTLDIDTTNNYNSAAAVNLYVKFDQWDYKSSEYLVRCVSAK